MRATIEPREASAPSPQQEWTRLQLAAIGASMLWLSAVALVRLGHKSLWVDEADTWYVVSGGVSHMWSTIAAWDANGAPYLALMWLWTRLGDTETILRFPSVVFGAATVPLIALLGRRLFDARVGVIAAVLFGVSGSALEYAQEARAYPLLALVSTASSLLVLRAERRGDLRSWVLYGLVSAFLVTVHVFGALAVAAHAVWLVLIRPDLVRRPGRGPVVAAVLVAATALPMSVAVLAQHSHFEGSTSESPFNPTAWLPIARMFGGGSNYSLLVFAIPVLLVVVAAVAWLLDGTWRRRCGDVFVVVGVAVPVLLTGAYAVLATNLLNPRYLLVALPVFVVLAARSVLLIPTRAAAALVVLLVLASMFSATRTLDRPTPQDFRRVAAELELARSEADQIYLFDSYLRVGLAYYLRDLDRDDLPLLVTDDTLDPVGWYGRVDVAEWPDAVGDAATTWVVVHVHDGAVHEDDAVEVRAAERAGIVPDEVRFFDGIGLVEFSDG